MSRVIITSSEGGGHTYPDASGANYDAQGFLTVVTGEDPDTEALAVWAPGRRVRADLVKDGATGPEEPSE